MNKILSLLVGILLLIAPILTNAQTSSEQLNANQEMIDFIERQPGKMSFYYKNIKTGRTIYYNPEEVFQAASTVKLPMALYVSEQAADNKVDLDATKTYEDRHYSGGSGVIQYEKVGNEYTLEDILEKSMVYSDNVAYIMLLEKFDRDNLIDYMHHLGGQYAYPNMNNVTTAKDMGLYLETLYEFSQQNKFGKELIKYLKHTDFNEAIPEGVHEHEVAHKIGYLTDNQVYHDVGIIYDDEPYLLAILSKGNTLDEEWETIAELTEIIQKEHEFIKYKGIKSQVDMFFINIKNAVIKKWHNLNETISNIETYLSD